MRAQGKAYRDLDQRERFHKAQIESKAAIKEKNHVRSLKRYNATIDGVETAKKKEVQR